MKLFNKLKMYWRHKRYLATCERMWEKIIRQEAISLFFFSRAIEQAYGFEPGWVTVFLSCHYIYERPKLHFDVFISPYVFPDEPGTPHIRLHVFEATTFQQYESYLRAISARAADNLRVQLEEDEGIVAVDESLLHLAGRDLGQTLVNVMGHGILAAILNRLRQAESRQQRLEADAKAHKLLLSRLTREQVLEYTQSCTITETGRSGAVYRLIRSRMMNIYVLSSCRQHILKRLCAVPAEDLPIDDQLLAQLLAIRTNEAELLQVAHEQL